LGTEGSTRLTRQLKIALTLLIVGALLTTVAFLMAFFTAEVQTMGVVNSPTPIDTVYSVAPPEWQPNDGTISYERPWLSQKIFYFHVPVAEISFLVFGFAAFYSIRFIMTRKREYDTKAKVSMEVTLVFVLLTMATGILWTRAAWGVWWDWEPRLTTYFIMTLLVIAYFVLRNAVEDEERRALYGAAFSILAFIDVPISFFITRLIPSNHPVIESGGLEGPMLVSFIVAQIGMIALGYAIYQLRMGEMQLRDRIEQAKKDGWKISYSRVKPEWASYSGTRGDRILYVRGMWLCEDAAAFLQLEYRKQDLKAYDMIIKRMVASLKPVGCPQ